MQRICAIRNLLAAAVILGSSSELAGAKRPNVVFLLTDDQRWDTLGCYGNEIIHTPHIDSIARRGVTFDRAFVTSSICAPTSGRRFKFESSMR